MEATTIKIHKNTKRQLDQLREYPNESYDEVIRKMGYIIRIAKNEPKLSQETIQAIEQSRREMAEGKYYTLEEVEEDLRQRRLKLKSAKKLAKS